MLYRKYQHEDVEGPEKFWNPPVVLLSSEAYSPSSIEYCIFGSGGLGYLIQSSTNIVKLPPRAIMRPVIGREWAVWPCIAVVPQAS